MQRRRVVDLDDEAGQPGHRLSMPCGRSWCPGAGARSRATRLMAAAGRGGPRSSLSPSMPHGGHSDRRSARIIRRVLPPVSAETIRVPGNDLPSRSDMQLYDTYRRERDIYRNPSKPRIPATPGTGRPRPVITILIRQASWGPIASRRHGSLPSGTGFQRGNQRQVINPARHGWPAGPRIRRLGRPAATHGGG